ncbi:MAG: hypothetical protein H6719_13140 [Sandaracinaceae bacterium]|nr:hypothetical protein [Sandaracinaceae bacterium]
MSVPAKSRVKGPIGQTVLEVLGTMMTPDTAAEVLRRALERSARSSIPENAERVRELAEGELRAAVIEMVGVEVADSFLAHLDPILGVISSGVRPRQSAERPKSVAPPSRSSSFPPPRREEAALRVIVVTAASLEDLKRHLGSFADVGRVRDAFELITALETRTGPLLVVVDGYRPAVDVATLAMFLPRIPDGCRVALWGFTTPDARRVETFPGWSIVDAGADWGALADALTNL